MKIKVDILGIGKLETTPVDSSNLNDAVNNEVVKITMMNWLKTLMSLILADLLKDRL